jgi:hypothetical protein
MTPGSYYSELALRSDKLVLSLPIVHKFVVSFNGRPLEISSSPYRPRLWISFHISYLHLGSLGYLDCTQALYRVMAGYSIFDGTQFEGPLPEVPY